MLVASCSVIGDAMTEHEHAAGQKSRGPEFPEEASGIERGLIWIDARSLPSTLSCRLRADIAADSGDSAPGAHSNPCTGSIFFINVIPTAQATGIISPIPRNTGV